MGDLNFDRADGCCLCQEIASGQFPTQYRTAYSIESRVSSLGDDFVALPTLSPLNAGHVLVLPRRHVSSLADLPESSWQTLLSCVRSTVTQLEKTFSVPFYFFEHGARTIGHSCGIDHAHLHILPLAAGIADTVRLRIQDDFPTYEQGTFIDALFLAAGNAGQPYLLQGVELGSMDIAFDARIPSQYVRQLIANVQGTPYWDWKLLNGRDR